MAITVPIDVSTARPTKLQNQCRLNYLVERCDLFPSVLVYCGG
jgi:hypothetical protein